MQKKRIQETNACRQVGRFVGIMKVYSRFILRGYRRVYINKTGPVLTEFDNDGKSQCHLSFGQIRIITGRPAGHLVGNSINQKKCFSSEHVSIYSDIVRQVKLTDRPRCVKAKIGATHFITAGNRANWLLNSVGEVGTNIKKKK